MVGEGAEEEVVGGVVGTAPDAALKKHGMFSTKILDEIEEIAAAPPSKEDGVGPRLSGQPLATDPTILKEAAGSGPAQARESGANDDDPARPKKRKKKTSKTDSDKSADTGVKQEGRYQERSEKVGTPKQSDASSSESDTDRHESEASMERAFINPNTRSESDPRAKRKMAVFGGHVAMREEESTSSRTEKQASAPPKSSAPRDTGREARQPASSKSSKVPAAAAPGNRPVQAKGKDAPERRSCSKCGTRIWGKVKSCPECGNAL